MTCLQRCIAPLVAISAAAFPIGAQTISLLDFEGQSDGVTINSISENGNFWFAFAGAAAELPVGSLLQPDASTYPDGYVSTISGDFSPGFGYLEVEGDAFSLENTDWTIETRVRFNAVGGFQTMLGRDRDLLEDRTPLADLYFQKNSADLFSCSIVTGFIDNGDGTFTIERPYTESTTVAQAGVWYHVAAVYDSSAQTLNLYVNGELEDSQPAPNNIIPVSDPFSQFYSVGRGSYAGNAVDGLNGQVDDLRITAAALTPSEFLYVGPCVPDLDGDQDADSDDVFEIVTRVGAGCDLAPRHTYVDAVAGVNTGPTSNIAPGPVADGLWGQRVAGNNGTIFEASGVDSGIEDAGEIATTITGLTPGESYLVYVHFWDTTGGGQTWPIRAGFESGNLELFASTYNGAAAALGGTGAVFSQSFPYVNEPLFVEADREMLAARVGVADADPNGEIVVYIDDLPAVIGFADRSWYDGVSYVPYDEASAYTFVEADSGSNTGPASAFSGATALEDNLWGERTLGNNGLVYESSGVDSGIENSPEISTTISGLTPGEEYNIWVNFWDPFNDSFQNWPIRAGFTSGSLPLFANGPDGGALLLGAEEAVYATDLTYSGPLLLAEANRALMAGYVGSMMADGNGELVVFIDDYPSTVGANERTWYEGVSYGPPPRAECDA